jgi:hypothetical protein
LFQRHHLPLPASIKRGFTLAAMVADFGLPSIRSGYAKLAGFRLRQAKKMAEGSRSTRHIDHAPKDQAVMSPFLIHASS